MGRGKSVIQALIITVVAICLLVAVLPKLILLLFVKVATADRIRVGCQVDVLSVEGSNGDCDSGHKVVSNGSETFVNINNRVYQIKEDELILVKELEQFISSFSITDKYVVYDMYDELYRYDIATGEEVKLLEDISIDYVHTFDDAIFVAAETLHVSDGNGKYNYLIIYESDDTQGVRISLDDVDEPYQEEHVEDIIIYTTIYKDYRIFVGEMSWGERCVLAVEQDGKLYSFRREGMYMVDERLLTMDRGRYRYNNQLGQISSISESNMKYFGCLSRMYNDDVYVITREGVGYTALGVNPIAVNEDYLLKVSPKSGEDEVLYAADDETRIVGFDAEANDIYLLNHKGRIYRQNLESQEKEFMLKVNDSYNILYFEWCEDKLYVIGYDGDKEKLVGSCSCR